MTRGDDNVAWIEANCIIPEGKFVGRSVELRPWQRKIVMGIYDSSTRRAIISFGRKNAKTTLSAFLLLLHLVGPEARANSQLYSAAQSRDQAAILFSLAAKIVRMSPTLNPHVTVRDTVKQLYCPELGTLYRALSADASTAYGLSPVFTVHDELGQVRGPRSELYEALETASGAQEAPLSIVISTQAPSDADLLSLLIDDARLGEDPRTKLFMFSADEELDPFSEKAWKAANPAYGDFLNADEVREQAEAARRMPSREPGFRNLILNQRVEARAPFVSRAVWMQGARPLVEHMGSVPVYVGLDLSSVSDLTALVAIWQAGGQWNVAPFFWMPEQGIRDRAKRDQAPYDVWAKQGHLLTTPGPTVDYDYVAEQVLEMAAGWNLKTIAFDRWRIDVFKASLARAGASPAFIEQMQPFGQGYQSMSPAMDALERELLAGRIAHAGHPVLKMCAANAVVRSEKGAARPGDEAGNRKLDKSKSTGRIDGMVALVMAMGIAAGIQKPVPTYSIDFV